MEDEHETSAFRHSQKKSGMSISACFHLRTHSSDHSLSSISSPSSSSSFPSPNYRKSPTSWFRSHNKSHELPDMIKPKRSNLMSCMGRHRRHASADFQYDPLSYALNFADEEAAAEDDRDQNHNFVSRLPVTPPRRRAVEGKGWPAGRRRDSLDGELRTNVFEVRVPQEVLA